MRTYRTVITIRPRHTLLAWLAVAVEVSTTILLIVTGAAAVAAFLALALV